jgi:hypothetical protein
MATMSDRYCACGRVEVERLSGVPAEVLRSLKPRQAAAWLRANGWELVDTRPEHTATWRKAAGAEGEFQIELPLDPTFRDYARRMGEILDTLAVASGNSPTRLLEEVRLLDAADKQPWESNG